MQRLAALNGTLDIHVKLEAELATLVRKEIGHHLRHRIPGRTYAALSALAEKGDVLLCDQTLHASLLEGAMRSSARTARFRHNDLGHLERCLQNCSSDERVLIVSEGVFSMEGDRRTCRESSAWRESIAPGLMSTKRTGSGFSGLTERARPNTWACSATSIS